MLNKSTRFINMRDRFPLQSAIFICRYSRVLRSFVLPTSPFGFPTIRITMALVMGVRRGQLRVVLNGLITRTIFTIIMCNHYNVGRTISHSNVFFQRLVTQFFFRRPRRGQFRPRTNFTGRFFKRSRREDDRVTTTTISASGHSQRGRSLDVFCCFVILRISYSVYPSTSTGVSNAPFRFPRTVRG